MYAGSVSGLSAEEVRCRLAQIKVERARLDAEEASLVARLGVLAGERSSCVVPEFEVSHFGGLRGREASRVVQRADMLGALPEFGSALASGSIVAGHVDVLADTVKKVSEVDRDRVLAELHARLQIPGTELVRGANGIAEGVPAHLEGITLPKFRPGGIVLVHAGGGAGLFSAIIGGWANGDMGSTPVTKEVTR